MAKQIRQLLDPPKADGLWKPVYFCIYSVRTRTRKSAIEPPPPSPIVAGQHPRPRRLPVLGEALEQPPALRPGGGAEARFAVQQSVPFQPSRF